MTRNEDNIQKVQRGVSYVRQHVNEAYEAIWNDLAKPPVQPRVQLKEGWQNGNIHFDTIDPVNPVPDPLPEGYPHTWDIWCVTGGVAGEWNEVTKIFVRLP